MDRLPRTVSVRLLDEMTDACGAAFADSYLCNAVEAGGTLTPKTRYAWRQLRERGRAMRVLRTLEITLIEPLIGRLLSDRLDLTEQEYEALSMTDKIAHRSLLADEAKTKAGPQWKGGRPATPDEMSDDWQHWRGVARGHSEEAAILKKRLGEVRGRG